MEQALVGEGVLLAPRQDSLEFQEASQGARKGFPIFKSLHCGPQTCGNRAHT